MPMNYQFVRKDGLPESLLVIDRQLCEHFGDRESPNEYHWSFHSVTWEGLAILAKAGVDTITPEVFDEFAVIDPNAEAFPVMRKFLAEDYSFTAWYEPSRAK
jgi:hypothetical protein